ncbi:MAG TPA: hypothetical protein VGL20_20920 [Candidatus Dormibacteraeota bacterium]|jgi:hypothetical protein
MNVWTRRGALKSGVALLAGAVGLEVVGRARDGAAAELALPLPAVPPAASTVVLHARRLRAVPVGGRPGMPVEHGARLTLLADLVDAGGAVVGSLTGVSHCTVAPLSSDDWPVGAIETHTLSLRDGTILGMGTAPAVAWGTGAFAVVGGTGRYAGATGSYVAEQQNDAAGGRGCARYTLTLTAAEDHQRGI